jgi:sugar (pentulose or hexulose) kinase
VRGAGLFAGLSLGKLTMDGVPALVQVTDTYEPDSAAQAVYEPMYAEFKRLYRQLHGVYARLNGPQ